jgi:NAD-dependent dihydropyrimidine dehydrogenase PreA subunit
MGAKINQLGYVFAKFDGADCTGCGLCFYSCPEPGAITVFECKADKSGK